MFNKLGISRQTATLRQLKEKGDAKRAKAAEIEAAAQAKRNDRAEKKRLLEQAAVASDGVAKVRVKRAAVQ